MAFWSFQSTNIYVIYGIIKLSEEWTFQTLIYQQMQLFWSFGSQTNVTELITQKKKLTRNTLKPLTMKMFLFNNTTTEILIQWINIKHRERILIQWKEIPIKKKKKAQSSKKQKQKKKTRGTKESKAGTCLRHLTTDYFVVHMYFFCTYNFIECIKMKIYTPYMCL